MSEVPENCGTCKFFRNAARKSVCVRFPPTPIFDSVDDRYASIRPNVDHTDTCGEWHEREGVR